MLLAGGKKTGLFTSPHLVRINERFQINGEDVSDEQFLDAFLKVEKAAKEYEAEGEGHPSYFETLFLMGMLIFKEAGVEYLVMETGLGGRLDATNVVEKPLACIITSISRDHTEYLGDTLEAIAGEKAGIIKAGVPVIYDASQPGPASVIAAKAKEMGSPAWPMEPSFYEMKTQSREGITFTFAYPGGEKAELAIPYVAKYQMMNASLAFYMMHILQDVHDIPKNVLARKAFRRSNGRAVWKWLRRASSSTARTTRTALHSLSARQAILRKKTRSRFCSRQLQTSTIMR